MLAKRRLLAQMIKVKGINIALCRVSLTRHNMLTGTSQYICSSA